MSTNLVRFVRQLSATRCATSCLLRHQSTTSEAAKQDLVLVDVNDQTGYSVVTLNRPPVNSLNLELLSAFSKTLDELQNNRSRGMILTSVIKDLSLKYVIPQNLKISHFSPQTLFSVLDWISWKCTSRILSECVNSGPHCKIAG